MTKLFSQGQVQTSSPNRKSLASSPPKRHHRPPFSFRTKTWFFPHVYPNIPTTEFHPKVISNPQNGSSPCIACSFVDIFQEQEQAGRCGFLPLQPRHVSNHCPVLPARTQKQERRRGHHALQSPEAVAEHHDPSSLPSAHTHRFVPQALGEALKLQGQVSAQQTALARGWRNSLAGPSSIQRVLSILWTTQQVLLPICSVEETVETDSRNSGMLRMLVPMLGCRRSAQNS